MLSKIIISALLVLQSGLVAAGDSSGRKGLGINARGLIVRQSTCPANSFMCADGTGCCDIGTTCGFRASDNFPVCKGGSCNGGPICLSGLCCDLGYDCDENAKLCVKSSFTSNPLSSLTPVVTSASSTKALSSASTKALSSSPTKASTRTLSSATPTSSADDGSDPSTATDDPNYSTLQISSSTRRTAATTAFPTSIVDLGSPTSFPNSRPTSVGNSLPTSLPLTGGAEAHSANSVVKVIVGAVAGVLAFVL